MENAADKRLHGVDYRGECNPAAKLTDDAVRALRRRHDEGLSNAAIARETGLTSGQVSEIVNRRRWTHI